ncbi:DUF3857 domain-containing protein [Mucilaginibacter mali]|uniref:DUF3857 domain-containing protein n=1 Tax=Mucilaginibacter mali TaxID=2740462 RepID=A0A7D4PW75_9SPHI|nr:DUF3857 domain-containing protein [Mucilaginibacter mali]QKJ32188.1 DUF3857 domain-containing protein [Mucilaginibacter mali]
MKYTTTMLLACLLTASAAIAQKKPEALTIPTTQPYGKIDIADLELKNCDFEKDANAMVLFDKADTYYDSDLNTITMERHKRIKVFNDNGKDVANIRIEYISASHYEYITGLDAETFNLVNGKVEITKLDKKVLYTETVDKSTSAIVFSFPNVKPGSVIEFKYKWGTPDYSNLPDWSFQSKIPTRYSEWTTQIPDLLYFTTQSHVTMPYVVNKNKAESRSVGSAADVVSYTLDVNTKALANIPSLPDEPYMGAQSDNEQSLIYHLTYVKPTTGFVRSYSDSWAKLGGILADHEDFGAQLKRKLANEDAIIAKAKTMKLDRDKMIYIFKEVQSAMKWDGVDRWYTNDGTVKAWEKKTGNSSEVNLILYHLLYRAGVEAYPMVVSTRSHGKVNPAYSFLYQFNRAVVYKPIDEKSYYILDATGKYNTYNEIPDELLNSTGLYIDKDDKRYNTVVLKKENPVQQVIMVSADIKPDGKMNGTANLSEYSYNRIKGIKKYKTDGEQKYIDFLRNNDNSLKISALKLENMEVDTLPLAQTFEFKQDLTGSDGNYIYFMPAMFAPMRNNPFLKEERMSDIDFGYRDNFSMVGTYKMPEGYKADALPKNITMQMPDESIIFRRIVAEQDGNIVVRFVIDHKKPIFYKQDYDKIFDFYKKLHELMNEQIVLKKA